MSFDSWRALREANRTLAEAEGVSRAIHGVLKDFFSEHGEGSYEQAKDYVASKVKGWDLSQEDYDEAKKEFIKESVNEADEKKEEKGEEKGDSWKTQLNDFVKSDARHLEDKATVFPEEIQSIVSAFQSKHKDVEADESDMVAYVKELLGMDESKLEESKMGTIDLLSRESSSKEEFEQKLKEYVKEIGKPELANDKDFIEAMTSGWKLEKTED